jgi:hypothetical protein
MHILPIDMIYKIDADGCSDALVAVSETRNVGNNAVLSSPSPSLYVSHMSFATMQSNSPISTLLSGDKVSLRGTRDAIGPRSRLTVLANHFKYNTPSYSKVLRMLESYSGWRHIRGDGNCYYRLTMTKMRFIILHYYD